MGWLLPALLVVAAVSAPSDGPPPAPVAGPSSPAAVADSLRAPEAPPAAPPTGAEGGRLEVRAIPLPGPVTIDGALTEPVWQGDGAFGTLIQHDPVEGAPPSQRTEVRVGYDHDAIYVGARLYDTAPDSVQARLARRDAGATSDRFGVYLDPYHDRRSGYYFMVNAAGTLYDGTLSNDVDQDAQWDGVWEGKARRDDQGWTVEMRIPFSQLRCRAGERPVWGINFLREIPRRRERDYVVYRPRKASGFVSRFPDLVGIARLAPGRAIEIIPYVTAQGEYLEHAPGDPFNDGSRLRGNTGGDLRARLGPMTLNLTANPDFGHVEVDPAVVNLTDVESFFEEKRPFFVAGASTYQFGRQGAGDYWDFDWKDPLFFYSRRIGRAPQGKAPASDYADIPLASRILGAANLTGRISPTWSFGTLQAITDRETARLDNGGRISRATVEPLTWYGVVRTQYETAGRQRGVGFLGTGTARSFDRADLRDHFISGSLLTGLDGWSWLDHSGTWVLSGWTALSDLQGMPRRLIQVQRSSLHYFQRPDAHHVAVDSSATSLAGFAGRYWIDKQKGAVKFNAAVGFVSPKFDVDDLGFQERSDLVNAHVGTGYQWTHPNRFFTYQLVKGAVFQTSDYGSHRIKRGAQVSGYTELLNGWTWDYYLEHDARALNNRRTRGGPLTVDPPATLFGTSLQTNSGGSLDFYVSADGSTASSGSWGVDVYPGIDWEPGAAFSLSIGPGWERAHEDAGYVAGIDDPAATATFGKRYVFATLDERTASASVRINWTFSPTLSLQTYLQPFVSSASYRDFKALVRPASYDFAPTAYGENLDFTVRSLKGNAVLRWEYRPGSALFLVWTQDRSTYDTVDAFSLSLDPVLHAHPESVFLAKLSYYFTP